MTGVTHATQNCAERVMSEADDADVATRFSQVEKERGLDGLQTSFGEDVARWEESIH